MQMIDYRWKQPGSAISMITNDVANWASFYHL